MALKVKPALFKNKILITLICAIGIAAISYGMLRDNNLIFFMGLPCVIVGYLLLRKNLKASIGKKDI